MLLCISIFLVVIVDYLMKIPLSVGHVFRYINMGKRLSYTSRDWEGAEAARGSVAGRAQQQ